MGGNTFDVFLAGGGVIGCAIAYYLLKADDTLKVGLYCKKS